MGDVLSVVVVVVVVAVLVVGAARLARASGRSRRGAGGGPAPSTVRGGMGGGGRGGPGDDDGIGHRFGGADGRPRPATSRDDAGAVPGPTSSAQATGRGEGEVIGPEVGREAAPPVGTLPELLRGIEVPSGLVPSTGVDHPDPAQYLALVTTGHRPADVGSAMGDELERLGYELHSLSEAELIARRGGDLLSLRLHPEAGEAREGGVALFPTAGPGTVAVELWVGAGPSPRTAP